MISPAFDFFLIAFSILILVLLVFSFRKYQLGIRNIKQLKIEYEYELEIEKTINYFASSLFGHNTVEDIVWDVSKNCISKLNFEDCVIYLFNEEETMLVQKAAFGPKNIDEYKIYNPIEIPFGKGIVGTVAKTGIPEMINDTSKEIRYIPDDKYRLSELSVPIKHQGKVIGVIDSENSEKNFFNSRHLQILSTIASLAANKIVSARAVEKIHQSELRILEMNQRITELRLKAFRAQMNPHFIFNCMSAIQEFILTGKNDEANNYLSKFSRLLRIVLENSEYNYITLHRELELLHIYLELESARFRNQFSYEINVEAELDEEEILIPTMIIQPFVENAIWHGLLHKEGESFVSVNIKRENEMLVATVKDNGIGRQKANENKINGAHISKALQLISEKLDLIKHPLNNNKTGFTITDLQQPTGTLVTIKVPAELREY